MNTDRIPLLQQSLSRPAVFGCILLPEAIYDLAIRHMQLPELLWLAPLHAALYCSVLWLVMTLDLARMTILFLAIPYFIFFIGWLNIPVAFAGSLLLLYCLQRTQENCPETDSETVTVHHLLAFMLVLVWLNLSGCGGYGHQSYDYVAHSARLNDLINLPWPVRYEVTYWGQGHNLVYYLGYFLPAAVIGKLSSYDTAVASLHLWTLFGLTMVLRWFCLLTGARFHWLPILLFIVFGPQDILGMIAMAHQDGTDLGVFLDKAWNGDLVEFWASAHTNNFLGSFLSNYVQLAWSPPQVIAGWLMAGLLLFLYRHQRTQQLVFTYSLLCLWAPFPMIALAPLLACATLPTLLRRWRDVLTPENILGAGMLVAIFLAYYLAGSAGNNPSHWMWLESVPWKSRWLLPFMFYLFTWGLYAIAVLPAANRFPVREQWWFTVLLLTMLLFPLRSYGNYNDLLCRGSAPLMFLLLVHVNHALIVYRERRNHLLLSALVLLLLLGTASFFSQLQIAIQDYGKTQPVRTVTDYRESRETLGPDGTFFERYLRKHRD